MIKINGKKIKFSKFPNNETLVDTEIINNTQSGCRIDFKWEQDEDILHLYFTLAHLKLNEVENKSIYIYYMPYSRMDRNQNGNCFTLLHVCDLINQVLCHDDYIYIVEPHSNKTLELLNNSNRINAITPLMKKICNIEEIDVICYPDKGAKLRFCDDAVDLPVVYCEKVRDFDTGEIKGLELKSDIDLTNKNVLILDDLCSKGGTFYYTAKKLQENKVKNIFLGVCHMENTVIQGKLLEGKDTSYESLIKHVYCFNTMLTDFRRDYINSTFDNITVYDIEELINENNKCAV